jgi:hypothetical protein
LRQLRPYRSSRQSFQNRGMVFDEQRESLIDCSAAPASATGAARDGSDACRAAPEFAASRSGRALRGSWRRQDSDVGRARSKAFWKRAFTRHAAAPAPPLHWPTFSPHKNVELWGERRWRTSATDNIKLFLGGRRRLGLLLRRPNYSKGVSTNATLSTVSRKPPTGLPPSSTGDDRLSTQAATA